METKNITIIAVIVVAVVCIAAAAYFMTQNNSKTSEDTPETQTDEDTSLTGKTLVVYFSATGVTDKMAKTMADYIGADIYQIVPEQEYTSEDLNRDDPSCRCNQESASTEIRPAIASEKIDVSKYDNILLGYPIWYHKSPRIIMTFLDSYDLSGKNIVTFCTSWGTGIATSHSELKPLEPNANWIRGTNFTSSATDSELTEWLKSIGFQQKSTA